MSKKKSLRDAYLLTLGTALGFAGIHRFYLGKPVSGFFYLITWGWFGIGTLVDLVSMPRLVEESNRRLYLDGKLDEEDYFEGHQYYINANERNSRPSRPEAKSLEHLALILAEENAGVLTVGQLALESGIAADRAKGELEALVMQGVAKTGRRNNGIDVYVFPEFLNSSTESQVIY